MIGRAVSADDEENGGVEDSDGIMHRRATK
jgi:hypothetical protein